MVIYKLLTEHVLSSTLPTIYSQARSAQVNYFTALLLYISGPNSGSGSASYSVSLSLSLAEKYALPERQQPPICCDALQPLLFGHDDDDDDDGSHDRPRPQHSAVGPEAA